MRRSQVPVAVIWLVLLVMLTIATKGVVGDGTLANRSSGQVQESLPAMADPESSDVIAPIKRWVMIDAGHGGNDPGSPGASKKDEKWFTLDLAQKVYERLQDSETIIPVMSRTDDVFISTKDRAARANEMKVDLFVSIHANSYKSAKIRGTETYYYSNNSLPLAEMMHSRILEATGFLDRGVRQMDYVVLKETNMSAVLLEIGYISHPEEEAAMLSEQMLNKVASAIVKGIEEFIETINLIS